MIWPMLAKSYLEIFDVAFAQPMVKLPSASREIAARPCLSAVERLTDSCGIMQHSIFSVPDRNHGYCVDDNARALILMHRLGPARDQRSEQFATTYASFVQHAWNSGRGVFRNFMGYDRRWLEETGSEDSFGRSLWSIGVTADEALGGDLGRWAKHLFDQVAPHALKLISLRARAFALFGAVAMLRASPDHPGARAIIDQFGQQIHASLIAHRRSDWRWFEPVLTYDNARLAEALMRAGVAIGDEMMVADAIDALAWLDRIQTAEDGYFRAVGTEGFGRAYVPPLHYDQQPLEAWASVDAALFAWELTGETRWHAMAMRAWRWYLGENDLCQPMASMISGTCFDGLMRDHANLNMGAESVLAFQLACCAIAQLSGMGAAEGASHAGAGAVAA